jgi:ABC-2 type transport system ATP-binding protein
MSDPSPAIAVTGLRKSFGGTVVLAGIDLGIAPGSIFSLLGPNGAGKTTAVNIMTTLIRADAGEVRIGGYDVSQEPQAIRSLIGVTGQFSAVDPLLTGAENLALMGRLHHLGRGEAQRRTTELVQRFDLAEAFARPASTYSGGQTRRLDLAMSLIGQPRILFLDEPTTGLDPRSRRTMWEAIRELAATGVTVFLTTQYLDEADQLADRIALLDHGSIVAEGTPAELKRLVPGGHITVHFTDVASLDAAVRALGEARRDETGLSLQIASDGSMASVKEVIDRLDDSTISVESLAVHAPDLDDVFFALTGRAEKVGTP